MKIVIPGGTGQVGTLLRRSLTAQGHDVVVLTRQPTNTHEILWDARNLGAWTKELEGADAVINLAGRSVSCRYNEANLKAMMNSRVRSTELIGKAIAHCDTPPAVWLQASTATIYAHRHDAPNDEPTGIIGGTEPGVPAYWEYSVRIAKAWEQAQQQADTPHTRQVALRSAMTMSPDRGGIFDYLSWLARLGLGGPVAGGAQYVSWIHEHDFTRALTHLLTDNALAGPINLASPNPLPHRDFMRTLRKAWRMPLALPASERMARIGAFVLRSDAELLLKSRRVVPTRLLEAGFEFDYAHWNTAAAELVERRSHSRL